MHVAWHAPESLGPAPLLASRARARGIGVYSLDRAPVHCADLERLGERVVLFGYPCLSPPRIRAAIETLARAARAL